jgi:hypothetical protein
MSVVDPAGLGKITDISLVDAAVTVTMPAIKPAKTSFRMCFIEFSFLR